jgi:molybdate transport system permease protein
MSLIPLLLSLRIAGLATVIAVVIGMLLAALLVRSQSKLASLLDAAANLPLVLPPTVLGYYLLVALGAGSPIGQFFQDIGIPLVFTWRGAVIAAALASLPLVVQSGRAALEAVDPDLLNVARTLGRSERSIFFSVTLPLAWRGVLAGSVLAFARALGEFGATLMVAGNIPSRTQTMPIAIYDAVQAGNMAQANILALVLTITAVMLLISIRTLAQRVVTGS